MAVPDAEIPQVEVDMTVVDGEIVHQRGKAR
jgi:predicted amidohydrolase YtcJ